MPSEKFMQEVLASDSARFARGEVAEPLEAEEVEDEDQPEDPAEEEEAPESEADADGEDADPEEEVVDELPDDDDPDADEEPEPPQPTDELIFGRYRTMEEAERGLEETRRAFHERSQRAAEAERERDELKQQLAYHQGQLASRSGGEEEFDTWADARIERNPEQGMIDAIQVSRETDDQSYAYAYTDRWAASDPYQAAIWRNRLETAVFQTQRQSQGQDGAEPQSEENGVSPVQQAINDTWSSLTEEYPDFKNDDTAAGIAQAIRTDAELREWALSGDPRIVRVAFLSARKVYRTTKATPRKVRAADAAQVARDKRAATVPTGDGAPQRRPSSPVMSAEEESILAGADKLGLKRRSE